MDGEWSDSSESGRYLSSPLTPFSAFTFFLPSSSRGDCTSSCFLFAAAVDRSGGQLFFPVMNSITSYRSETLITFNGKAGHDQTRRRSVGLQTHE